MRTLRFVVLTLVVSLALAGVTLANPDQDYREGMTAAGKGDMDGAIAAFSRIIDAGSTVEAKNLASAYNLRGMCFEAKNEQQKALADYSKAVEIDPKSAEALGNRSMLYMKLGEVEKAKEDATAAKRIDRHVKVPDFK